MYPRMRLYRDLDQSVSRPLTWVASSAGSGKTCLVAGYTATQRRPCIWLHVDRDDAEPATFFHYLTQAARTIKRGLKLPKLLPEYRSRLDTFSRRYFRELFEGVPEGTLLVLDNYEALPDDCELHELFADAVLETPAGLAWVVVSRREPPAQFARCRVAGGLSYWGWESVRFSLDESRELVRLLAGDDFASSGWLEELHASTQGWAAGVVLAVGSVRARGSRANVRDPGGQEALFDYFASEVFRGLSAEKQALLLRTACLPEFTTHDARELTGNDDAHALLEFFVKKNYFTFRAPRGTWSTGRSHSYRYHPLFRHFLLEQASVLIDPETLAELKRRAARLCAESERLEQAVQLLLELDAWEELAELIPGAAPALLEQGRHDVLSVWLANIPRSLADGARFWLLYWKASARLPFNPTEAHAVYAEAFDGFVRVGDAEGIFLAWSGAVEALGYGGGSFRPYDEWIDALNRVLEELKPPSLAIEGRVAAMMFGALVFRRSGDPSIDDWEKRVRRFLYMSRVLDANQYVMLAIHVFHNDLWCGRIGKAKALLDSLDRAVRSRRIGPVARLAWHTMHAVYGHFTGDGEASVRAAADGLQFAEQSGVHFWDCLLLAQGAFGKVVSGDIAGARDYVARLQAVLNPEHNLESMCYYDAAAQVALASGESATALACSRNAVDSAVRLGVVFAEAILRVGTSEALFVCNQKSEALAELARAETLIEITGSTILAARCELARAEYALAGGQQKEAEAHVARAFAICREQGYTGLPWWRHAVVAELCELALSAGIEPDLTRELVRKWGFLPRGRGQPLAAWPWPVRVFTLGPRFRVLLDDKELSFDAKTQSKPLELLQTLIAFGGQDVGEHRLAEALWPDSEADAALQALATTLHRLRKLIGSESVRRSDQRLSLERTRCWVDCLSCETIWDRSSESSPDILDESLCLYRGPFLQESDQPWAEAYRGRLAAKFVRAVESRARYMDSLQAIDVYERALEAEPTSEVLYRCLIALLREDGRGAQAADVYRRCCVNLQASFGCGPSSETRRVAREAGR